MPSLCVVVVGSDVAGDAVDDVVIVVVGCDVAGDAVEDVGFVVVSCDVDGDVVVVEYSVHANEMVCY